MSGLLALRGGFRKLHSRQYSQCSQHSEIPQRIVEVLGFRVLHL